MPTYAEQPFVRIAPELHAVLKEAAAAAGESMAAYLDGVLRAALIPQPDPWEARIAALKTEMQAFRDGVRQDLAAQIRQGAILPAPDSEPAAKPAEIAPANPPRESLKDFIRKMSD